MILPTHLIYLDQIVLSELGFSGIDVVDDLAEMIDVAFRVERVGGNLKGTAIAAIVSDELTDAATQMAALYPFMKQLVTSGSYNVTGSDGKNEKHKVNLLNSSERYYIANEVVTRLEAINTDLFILAWQVRTLSWNDLWFSLDPEGWANVMSGKNIIGGIVAEWNQGYLLKW